MGALAHIGDGCMHTQNNVHSKTSIPCNYALVPQWASVWLFA